MRYPLLLALWALISPFVSPPALANDALVGTWEGMISVDPGKVEVEFRLSIASKNEGDIWFPTQGTARQPLIGLELEGDQVSFGTIDSQGVVASFTGELQGDEIEGSLSEQGVEAPFTLRRTSSVADAPQHPNPELHPLESTGDALRQAFNEDVDKVRLVVVLSPTCGVCRMGARMVENYLFDRFDDPRLSVYVVWEPQLEDDSEAAARDATFFLASERSTHFWSQERYAGKVFQQPLGLESPAWDVFMTFAAGTTWDATPPEFDFYMHNQRGHLPDENLLDAAALAERIDGLLAEDWLNRQEGEAAAIAPVEPEATTESIERRTEPNGD